MPSSLPPDAAAAWHPVAAEDDVPFRHVFHGQLLGQELAVWRADDGFVNVWDNRCLHRGVRLSIGANDGCELLCRYHSWRYANRTGGCTYIPAHPGDAPAASLAVATFPSAERYGLVWTTLAGEGTVPVIDVFDGVDAAALRGVFVDAPAGVVVASLAKHRFQPVGHLDADDAVVSVRSLGDLSVEATSVAGGDRSVVVYFVQPVDGEHCTVRGVLAGLPSTADRLAVLAHHDDRLTDWRDAVEAAWARQSHEPVAVTAPPPRPRVPPRTGDVRAVVARRRETATGVVALDLEPVGGVLPTVQPGAHIDVHLPNGLVRQYSLVNGPGEQDHYRIGVKREPASRGGSRYVHESLHDGDVLAVSAPHSNFPLRRDAVRTVLLAGGIGITPLLSMAQALRHGGSPLALHVFAQSASHVPFAETLDHLGDVVHRHLGLDPEATAARIADVLGPFTPASQVYVCGPGPMIEAARRIAGDLGWPEEAVHFEYFANPTALDDGTAFDVHLARTGTTLTVPAGRSLLAALREAGVEVASSCEQGACGTCLVGVVEGEPDHRDVYLRPSERARGDRMMACVSRARSTRLVLDL